MGDGDRIRPSRREGRLFGHRECRGGLPGPGWTRLVDDRLRLTYGCAHEEVEVPTETAIQKLRPEEAAERVFRARKQDCAWLDRFTECLAGYREGSVVGTSPAARQSSSGLVRTIGVWQLSQAKAAALFGVSRQAFAKWLQRGVPADHAVAVADLTAATDLLQRYLKRDRIPAVVRRPIPNLDDVSLLDLLGEGDTNRLLAACRDMFDFGRTHR